MPTTNSVIPASHADLLDSKALAHTATLGPDGEPHNNPVWFGWDGEFLRFSLLTRRQKYKNLQRDGRIAFSIVDPSNPYRYLEVRGTVVRTEPDLDRAFSDSMGWKYLNAPNPPDKEGDERVVIVVRPEHTTTMG